VQPAETAAQDPTATPADGVAPTAPDAESSSAPSSGVRRIDSPPAEPVDLLAAAGPSAVKPALAAGALLLLMFLLLGRRRRSS
jgi:hypothetical protein